MMRRKAVLSRKPIASPPVTSAGSSKTVPEEGKPVTSPRRCLLRTAARHSQVSTLWHCVRRNPGVLDAWPRATGSQAASGHHQPCPTSRTCHDLRHLRENGVRIRCQPFNGIGIGYGLSWWQFHLPKVDESSSTTPPGPPRPNAMAMRCTSTAAAAAATAPKQTVHRTGSDHPITRIAKEQLLHKVDRDGPNGHCQWPFDHRPLSSRAYVYSAFAPDHHGWMVEWPSRPSTL